MFPPVPGFSDYFSVGAAAYARYRPWYPPELLARLAALAPAHNLCWDVATGTGQAAVTLAEHFDRVIATDASERQIAHAQPHPKVEYRVELAERSSLADASVDLVTIAAALHWLALPDFYAEVRRVARPGAVFAAWSYGADFRFGDELDRVIAHHRDTVLGRYWPAGHRHIRSGYRTVEFPFAEIAVPATGLSFTGTLDDVLGVIGTWSASHLLRADAGPGPEDALRSALAAAWGPAPARTVEIPLFFRVGRIDPRAP